MKLRNTTKAIKARQYQARQHVKRMKKMKLKVQQLMVSTIPTPKSSMNTWVLSKIREIAIYTLQMVVSEMIKSLLVNI